MAGPVFTKREFPSGGGEKKNQMRLGLRPAGTHDSRVVLVEGESNKLASGSHFALFATINGDLADLSDMAGFCGNHPQKLNRLAVRRPDRVGDGARGQLRRGLALTGGERSVPKLPLAGREFPAKQASIAARADEAPGRYVVGKHRTALRKILQTTSPDHGELPGAVNQAECRDAVGQHVNFTAGQIYMLQLLSC